MALFPSPNEISQDAARYYRQQYENLLREQEAKQLQWEQDQDRRRREAQDSQHIAHDWEEAFRKGLRLAQREANDEAADEAKWPDADPPVGTFFREWVEHIKRAEQLYRDEMQSVREQVRAYEARLRNEALTRIAERLEAEFPAARETAEAIREDNHEYLVCW